MRRIKAFVLLWAAALVACSNDAPPPAPVEPPKAAIPAEIQAAATEVLGTESEVLVYGDLARTGNEQVLAINRLKPTPQGLAAATVLTRAAIVERDGNKWREVFRCDQHLRNPKGYLGATPVSPVPAWRLQYEQTEDKGLVMYFTPLARPAGGVILTIGVRWNPAAKRYQSLDRNFEQFVGEAPSLEQRF